MCEEDHLILWAMYIEKYLAKGFGSFESIEGGYMDEAFTLFTDGTTLSLRLFEEQPRTVLMLLEHVLALNGFAAAATENSQNTELLKNLQTGHAYAILDVYYVDVEAGAANRGVAFKEILLRIRNPHGQKSPNVAWSNKNHSLWSRVSKATKERVGYHRLHSGEFFFAFSDFCRHFEILQICNNSLPPTAGVFVRGQQTTEVFTLDGCWELGYSAGGSDDHEHAPFVTNPSFVSK
ncbi:calpain clp-1-like isoform X2 [Neocloeon triangulifer]|nr:calpain clp-1-like isoform X2 [Neocloeon triangulifer]